MTWVKIDDGFAEHPKVQSVSERAFKLHVTALCYCARNLTDGVLDHRAVRVVAAIVDKPCNQAVRDLVAAGLWDELGGDEGFVIRDYLEFNPSADEVKVLREKRRAAGQRGGRRSGQTRSVEAKAQASASSQKRSRGVEPRPLPVSTSKGFSHVAAGADPEMAGKPWENFQLKEIA